jgi:osmoprotectant transport system permease protein
VQRKKSSNVFEITPRNRFSGDFPATWMNMEKLNSQLTLSILEHLENLRKEKRRSVQDVVDIFIGSLNWKRLEENKPADVVLEPRPETKNEAQPRLKLWTLLSEQLFYICLPLMIGLLFGWPFGKSFYKNEWTRNFFTSLTSIFLTVPPIALLCFFLPSYGMGRAAALVTLSLVDILLIMKYSAKEPRLWSSHFVGRLKTVVIINVNFSTLAAFVGVGGFGSLISLGLALNDIPLILRGTLAVAFLAMALKWTMEGLEFALAKREERS